MMPLNNASSQNRENLIRQILKLADDIYGALGITVPPEWLSSDLTVAQLRVLLVLHAHGPSRMSSIASSIGITLSTATGIVDNLVRKRLVLREADPEDRRLVICKLSALGRQLINRLWALGRAQIEKLLHGLTPEQLEKVAEVARFLLANVMPKSVA